MIRRTLCTGLSTALGDERGRCGGSTRGVFSTRWISAQADIGLSGFFAGRQLRWQAFTRFLQTVHLVTKATSALSSPTQRACIRVADIPGTGAVANSRNTTRLEQRVLAMTFR